MAVGAVAPALIGCGKRPEAVVVTASRGPIEATVSSVNSGTTRSEQVAELAFGSVGRVSEVRCRLGQVVREGDVLAQVENADLESRMRVAAEELERAKRLSQSQAASRSNVIQAQGNYDSAVTAYQKSLIVAPFDGIVVEQNIEEGQLSQITALNPIAMIRLVDMQPRYVRAEIDEVDLPKVREGLPARVKILAIRREPFKATVRKVVPFVSSVREQDRTSEVELTVDNERVLLPPGASADVEIVTERKEGALVVNSKAVLGRGGDRYVYKLDGARVRRTPVQIGISSYTVTEILGGLSEGDRVVLPSEKIELKDGLAVRPVE